MKKDKKTVSAYLDETEQMILAKLVQVHSTSLHKASVNEVIRLLIRQEGLEHDKR